MQHLWQRPDLDHLHLVISGRHLRSLHRLRKKTVRKFQKALSRCKKGSNHWRKLLQAKYRFLNWVEVQISHVEHAITKIAAEWCVEHRVTWVHIGDPQGVREQDCSRYHNQRMNQWAFGRLRDLLEYKLKRHGIALVKTKKGALPAHSPFAAAITNRAAEYSGTEVVASAEFTVT